MVDTPDGQGPVDHSRFASTRLRAYHVPSTLHHFPFETYLQLQSHFRSHNTQPRSDVSTPTSERHAARSHLDHEPTNPTQPPRQDNATWAQSVVPAVGGLGPYAGTRRPPPPPPRRAAPPTHVYLCKSTYQGQRRRHPAALGTAAGNAESLTCASASASPSSTTPQAPTPAARHVFQQQTWHRFRVGPLHPSFLFFTSSLLSCQLPIRHGRKDKKP